MGAERCRRDGCGGVRRGAEGCGGVRRGAEGVRRGLVDTSDAADEHKGVGRGVRRPTNEGIWTN